MTDEERWSLILPEQIAYGVSEDGHVTLRLNYPNVPRDAGPFELGLALSPDQARRMAVMLSKKADEAEAAQPRH